MLYSELLDRLTVRNKHIGCKRKSLEDCFKEVTLRYDSIFLEIMCLHTMTFFKRVVTNLPAEEKVFCAMQR